jgi:hypothetical protein|nr:MAG TPA: hypothetical protein [Caudoviricetes sp.]
MLAALLTIPAGGSITVKFPFRKIGIRRLIVSSPHNDIALNYDGVPIIMFNSSNGFVELNFESYYGYPDSSLFSMVNNGTTLVQAQATVLVDYVPDAPINSNYFERS